MSLSQALKCNHKHTVAICFQDGNLEALSSFEALFKGARFHKGLEMVFTNTQAGALALKIGDHEVRTPRCWKSCRISPSTGFC